MAGSQKGLDCLSLDESFMTKNVMLIVVSSINFIKSRGLNSHQFKALLKDLESEYGNLVYYCEVGNMLMWFYELRDELRRELSKWLYDLTFMVDFAQYLSELNVKLQGPNQLLNSILSNVNIALLFVTTYCCEQFFSKLTDVDVEKLLQVSNTHHSKKAV
ncbi:GTD2B protein, partial [Amia calva]|nr:GTD2B protein [Amia calva]